MSRIQIWSMIWQLAMDSPIVGGGFRLDNLLFYQRYAPLEYSHGILGPHSIYFQVLGEHGFPGLMLFLGLGVSVWRTGNRIIARSRLIEDLRWADTLARMVQVSLIGFGISAAFGAMAHLDLVYYLVGIMVLADLATREPPPSSTVGSPRRTCP